MHFWKSWKLYNLHVENVKHIIFWQFLYYRYKTLESMSLHVLGYLPIGLKNGVLPNHKIYVRFTWKIFINILSLIYSLIPYDGNEAINIQNSYYYDNAMVISVPENRFGNDVIIFEKYYFRTAWIFLHKILD